MLKYELVCGDVVYKKPRDEFLNKINELSKDYEPILMAAVESKETKRSLVCILMKALEKPSS